jgi:hypothetical protein
MKRRSTRTAFSTAQLALWDELETARPAPAAATPAPSDRTPHASAPAPGPALRDARGGPR